MLASSTDATAISFYSDFIDSIFTTSVELILYVFGAIWPYLITIGVIVVFWRVGRAFFR